MLNTILTTMGQCVWMMSDSSDHDDNFGVLSGLLCLVSLVLTCVWGIACVVSAFSALAGGEIDYHIGLIVLAGITLVGAIVCYKKSKHPYY